MKKIGVYLYMCGLVIIDQLLKIIVINNKFNFPFEIIKKFLKLNYCENRGIAFGVGSGNVLFFSIINIILIVAMIIYYEFNKFNFNRQLRLFAVMVISGGIGNLIDRICRGFVVDYIDISNFVDFPIFNFADILVCLGVIGIIFNLILKKNNKKEMNNG